MKTDRESVIREIQRIAEKKGVDHLSRREFLSDSQLSSNAIYRLFDSWQQAQEMAGLKPLNPNLRLEENDLFEDMRRVFLECEGICTNTKFGKLSKYDPKTYYKRFGLWKDTLIAFKQWLKIEDIAFPFFDELPGKSGKVNADDKRKFQRGRIQPKKQHIQSLQSDYVSPERLNELRHTKSAKFDLRILVRLCEELNFCYANGCYLATVMIVRTIMNHVPPIFDYDNFAEVSNNYGGTSFKHSMRNLHNSAKNIADAHLHQTIRKTETLPNKTRVNFSNDLDVLLGEIIRILT